jgi:carboxyl-terminal processing protease
MEASVNRFIKYAFATVVVFILVIGSFSGGFVAGNLAPSGVLGSLPGLRGLPAAVSTPAGAKSATPSDLQTTFAPFWESWDLLHKNYVDQPLDDTKLMQGAISGMLGSLGDSHTLYMNPSQYTQANTSLAGAYDGIGAWVDATGSYLAIVSPMKGSPAEKAGLQAGDVILKVDGVDQTGVPGDLVIQKVMGPAGTVVTLTIQRGSQDPFDVKVTRAHITIPSVEGKMLGGGIAYVQLNTFGDKTTTDLKSTLSDLLAKNPKGLILDLRNNGGGYLNTAIEVVSQFIDKGPVVFEKYGDGHLDEHDAQPGGLALKIPMVVLINEGSASASEITAGALQDDGRAKLVGVVSYGKGSVQNWIPLSNNQGAVAITIAKWLTPLKRTIDHVGLTPDVVVKMTKDDVTAGRDPQLDAAIQTVLAIIK